MIIYKCDYCHDEFDTLEEYQADVEKCKKRFNNVYNIYCYNYTYNEENNEIHNYGIRKEGMLLDKNEYLRLNKEYNDYGEIESTWYQQIFNATELNKAIVKRESDWIHIYYYSLQEMNEEKIKEIIIDAIKKHLIEKIEKLQNNFNSLK
jgi:hypothetical protein